MPLQSSHLNITDRFSNTKTPIRSHFFAGADLLTLVLVVRGNSQTLVLEAVQPIGRVGHNEAVCPLNISHWTRHQEARQESGECVSFLFKHGQGPVQTQDSQVVLALHTAKWPLDC